MQVVMILPQVSGEKGRVRVEFGGPAPMQVVKVLPQVSGEKGRVRVDPGRLRLCRWS